MIEERLGGLALANIDKDDLDFGDTKKYILLAFMKRSPRKVHWTRKNKNVIKKN